MVSGEKLIKIASERMTTVPNPSNTNLSKEWEIFLQDKPLFFIYLSKFQPVGNLVGNLVMQLEFYTTTKIWQIFLPAIGQISNHI